MEAHAKSLEFICNEGGIQIPFFQRGYVWDEPNWDDLLTDLLNFKQNHFLGSLILKQMKPISGEPKQVLVIDGQQRLTTLSILVRATYDLFDTELKTNAADAIKSFLFYKRNRTDKKSYIKIRHSQIDAEAFKKVIENEDDFDLTKVTKDSSKIYRCYKFFHDRLITLDEETRERLFNSLLDQNNKMLVVIDLTESDNEQTIFDTINSAGVRLSAADIIKNSLFQRAHELQADESDTIELYKETWNATFLSDEETIQFWDTERSAGRSMRDNIEILLHSISVIESIYDPDRHTLSNLGEIYKDRISALTSFEQVASFAKKISEYAEIYRDKIASFNSTSILSYKDGLCRLLHILDVLQITTFHPFILHTLRKEDSEESRNKIFKMLERYVVRRMISNETFKNFNKVCKDFIASTDELKEKSNELPDDRISASLRDIGNKPATLLLFWIELYRRAKESDRYDVDYLKYSFSLEHIMPQKWDAHWPLPGTKDEDFERHNRTKAIYSIGNMTLLTTGLNSSLKNFELSRKINGEGRKKGIRSYADLSITKDDIVKPFDEGEFIWDERAIETRTIALEKTILNIW